MDADKIGHDLTAAPQYASGPVGAFIDAEAIDSWNVTYPEARHKSAIVVLKMLVDAVRCKQTSDPRSIRGIVIVDVRRPNLINCYHIHGMVLGVQFAFGFDGRLFIREGWIENGVPACCWAVAPLILNAAIAAECKPVQRAQIDRDWR
jgi:hypothetical protein